VTPFFFGPGKRRLFGAYDPAHAFDGVSRGGAVICYPWGAEYLHAHRSLRQLAARLAQNGFETLRFDYFGTGDSAGDMTDADLAGWEHDIETAIEEIIELAGVKRIALVGLRLGANLAASVAARRIDVVNPLILWDPIVSGKAYLHQFGLLGGREGRPVKTPVARPDQAGERHEIRGFPLTRDMALEFESLDLTRSLVDISVNSLIILSARLPWYASLQNAAGLAQGRCLEVEYHEDMLPWVERPQNVGTVPVKVINRIVDWIVQCK
jgi:pimeloyl-ACP methyl ester carboxylesterase